LEEDYEAFPPMVMQPEDMTDEQVTGFNDDEVLPRVDNVDQMVRDVEFQGVYTSSELARLRQFVKDSKTPLYPGCKKYSRLSGDLKLLQLKAAHHWTNRSFKQLLDLLKDILPEGNQVADSVYEAKKIICPLGLEVEKIHACSNSCVLFRGDYAALDTCPKCGSSRYKRKTTDDGGGEGDLQNPSPDEGDEAAEMKSKKGNRGGPVRVAWYFPIITRLKRMFATPKTAELLRWHSEGRKKIQGLLKHPADAAQWGNIDNHFPWFGDDCRNIRFAMSTDGVNPFGNQSSTHSTWPVVLSILNLPPWLCKKRKYLMLTILVSGPKQAGDRIDVYFRPLVDDLKKLWKPGVPEVWDEFKREEFTLHAMVFTTISDNPAQRNL